MLRGMETWKSSSRCANIGTHGDFPFFFIIIDFINFRIKIFLMTISCLLLSCLFSFFRVIAAVKCARWHLFICMKE